MPLDGCNEPIAVLTRILTAPEIGFEKQEKTENSLCVEADSGDLSHEQQNWGLGINGTKSSAKALGNSGSNGTKTYAKTENSEVAPLTICPAKSLQESTQHQDRALRVALQVLTPGTLDTCIPSEGQMGAGGISFISAAGARRVSCYTVSTFLFTRCGIKEKAGAASEASALSGFGEESNFEKRIPDVTNYKCLTTGKPGYSSGLADEFSLIKFPTAPAAGTGNISHREIESESQGYQSAQGASGVLDAFVNPVYLSSVFTSSRKPEGDGDTVCAAPIHTSSVGLSSKRPTKRLRGPPGWKGS